MTVSMLPMKAEIIHMANSRVIAPIYSICDYANFSTVKYNTHNK